MRNLKKTAAGLLAAGTIPATVTGTAHAEPLTPLSSPELQYLEQLRRVYAVSRDPISFRSDGELLNLGRSACRGREQHGLVGQGASFVSPAITQLAFIYLCPQ